MSISIWLPLFFSSPGQPACAPHGVPLLEMRQASERSTATTTTRIFSSGAWTVEADGGTRSGCFDRAELRAIRGAVQSSPWRTTKSPIACFAYDPNFTEYRVRGTLRFTERLCSGTAADRQTQAAIALVKQELAGEQPAPAATCRVAGTPALEIRKLSEVAAPTSRIAFYGTGAWTFQPIDEHGHLGAVTTGCLDKRTTASLRSVIARSPWETTLSRVVCKAYSPQSTQYFVNGRLEYTARLCGPERLDERSLAAIAQLEAELARVLPSPDAASPSCDTK
jgi:hypothetical protein